MNPLSDWLTRCVASRLLFVPLCVTIAICLLFCVWVEESSVEMSCRMKALLSLSSWVIVHVCVTLAELLFSTQRALGPLTTHVCVVASFCVNDAFGEHSKDVDPHFVMWATRGAVGVCVVFTAAPAEAMRLAATVIAAAAAGSALRMFPPKVTFFRSPAAGPLLQVVNDIERPMDTAPVRTPSGGGGT